jgi:hypothetical protein
MIVNIRRQQPLEKLSMSLFPLNFNIQSSIVDLFPMLAVINIFFDGNKNRLVQPANRYVPKRVVSMVFISDFSLKSV